MFNLLKTLNLKSEGKPSSFPKIVERSVFIQDNGDGHNVKSYIYSGRIEVRSINPLLSDQYNVKSYLLSSWTEV